MFGPCFLMGIFYMTSAAQDAKVFSNSLQASFGNLGVTSGTMLSGFFITKYSVAVTPWVGFIAGLLTVASYIGLYT
jgi:predicted MFS family arabinose efflux permease